jgi:succinyl-CoA synthetase beta subunit
MLANGKIWQYLIIAGAIANFTHIDRTFTGIIDALKTHEQALRDQKITILVRRGGINDKKWLALMAQACKELGIPCAIADGDMYMTDILKNIQLWNLT